MTMDSALTELITQLGILTAKNASATVNTRIKASRAAGKHDETVNELQDIIQELLDERAELQRIASALKEYALAESITVTDLKFITDTLIPAFEEVLRLNGASDEEDQTVQMVKKLASKEMLTILQLVGFNYKRAIGEPLTRVVENLITKDLPGPDTARLQAAHLERDAALAKIAANAKAVATFEKLRPLQD